MSSQEQIAKDIRIRWKYRFEDFVTIVLITMVVAWGILFIFLGFDTSTILGWNFFKILNIADVYLNGFFHRITESLTAIVNIVFSDDGSLKEKLDALINTVKFIWGADTKLFIPHKYYENFQDIENVAWRYFYLLVVYMLLWIYLVNYFFKLIPLPDKIKKIIYYPLNLGVFSDINDTQLAKLNADKGEVFKNIENTLINVEIEREDGYERVKTLKYLKDVPRVLISRDGKYANEFFHILQCFKNDDEFRDLFLIIEGYIAPKGKPYLFDEYIEHLSEEEFEKFKAYNLKDKIYFSLDAIEYYINRETERFEKIIDNRLLKGRINKLAMLLNNYKNNIIEDRERVTRMLFGINNKQSELRVGQEAIEEELQEMLNSIDDKEKWWHLFKLRLRKVLIAYFRFVLLRIILRRYTNIPAGTIVSKIDDYTLRNIVDNYDMNSIIEIQKYKNDGTSKSFENDLISNIFFASFYYYDNFEKNKIQEKINAIWNIDINDIAEEEFTEEKIGEIYKKIEEYKKIKDIEQQNKEES